MNHPADDPTKATWRCGNRTEGFSIVDLDVDGEICTLPAGHIGWHRADSGNQWSAPTIGCTHIQTPAPEGRQHSCVGDEDHTGPHWCLLGHTWSDQEATA